MVTTAAMVSPPRLACCTEGDTAPSGAGDREVVSAFVSHVGHTLCPTQKSSDTATKGVAELLAALSTPGRLPTWMVDAVLCYKFRVSYFGVNLRKRLLSHDP